MKILKRAALVLPFLFLLIFASVSYANSSSVKATATIIKCEKLEITIISPQDKSYNQINIPLTFKIKGTASWIKYSLDGGANVTITGNTTLTGLSEGSHNVIVYAYGCGKTEKEKVKFTVDTTPPKITIISPKNTSYSKDCVPLTFTINEPTSWIKYSLDGKSNVTIKKNITLTDLSEGAHSIIVYAKDKSGNEANSTTVYFTIVKGVLGSVDIGKMNDALAYSLGWSKPQPKTSGGTWGGAVDPTYWRTVSCTYCKEGDSAYAFVMMGNNPQTMRIEHLDGQADDSFDVYVQDGWKWVKIGHYSNQYLDGSEHIITTDFPIANNIHISGFVKVKITLTGKHWSQYGTYGQLAIHKIDVLGVSNCDVKCDDEHDDKH